jgi:predicted nuclease of restriction endonuclease-like RecB superfamily
LLTADLVAARRYKGELKVRALDGPARARAAELAGLFLEVARAHVGRARQEYEDAVGAIEVPSRDRRLADGILKLIEDRCEFDAEAAVDPAVLRQSLFTRASAARRALGEGDAFDRRALVEAAAAEHGLTAEGLERALYADLRAAHRLTSVAPGGAAELVERYDLAQAQAVLLRAVRVTVEVEGATPGGYRALFHKLKFLRLLYRISATAQGYRIEIDGPFSLFESVTKYGLQLALVLPALDECGAFRLEADVRWGKQREPLKFRAEAERKRARATPARLPDEVEALVSGLEAVRGPWRVAPAGELLDLPGVGICVPDLAFEHGETGETVYLEVLGFWSRAAVWRRVELVERGLPQRILFAVSEHLRVSEEALPADLPGALYVYKRALSARVVMERIERLAAARVR